jgi:hypothetical protein
MLFFFQEAVGLESQFEKFDMIPWQGAADNVVHLVKNIQINTSFVKHADHLFISDLGVKQ